MVQKSPRQRYVGKKQTGWWLTFFKELARRPAKFFAMNYEFYYAVKNFQSNQTSQLNFMHAIINEMSQNHQIVLQRSRKFCPLNHFCGFPSF